MGVWMHICTYRHYLHHNDHWTVTYYVAYIIPYWHTTWLNCNIYGIPDMPFSTCVPLIILSSTSNDLKYFRNRIYSVVWPFWPILTRLRCEYKYTHLFFFRGHTRIDDQPPVPHIEPILCIRCPSWSFNAFRHPFCDITAVWRISSSTLSLPTHIPLDHTLHQVAPAHSYCVSKVGEFATYNKS